MNTFSYDLTFAPAASSGTQRTTASATDGDNALSGLDYNAFLRLLIEQMRNQDPTEPMESTDYMNQLATFANVEQNVQIKQKLEEILSYITLGQPSDLLGKTVSTLDGEISGKVVSYEVYEDGILLVLEDGTRLPYGPGIVISDPGAGAGGEEGGDGGSDAGETGEGES